MSENILDRILGTKRAEVEKCKSIRPLHDLQNAARDAESPRDFRFALTQGARVSLIAEVKKASPSQGLIRADFDPVQIANIYQSNGASCISVLTDQEYFQGKLQYLTDVKHAVSIPVLRKEFIIDEYQIYEARAAGADAVLLIAECLDANQIAEYVQLVDELGMTSLVELYDRENLEKVLRANSPIIGVNNRDLRTFEVSLEHTIAMRREIPAEIPVVGESGIFTSEDVSKLAAANVQAILVGQSLMEKKDIGQAVRELLK